MFQVFNLPGMFDLCVKFGIFRLKAFDCVLKTFSILFCCKPLPTVVILIQNERSKFCTHKIRKIYKIWLFTGPSCIHIPENETI